MFTVKMFIPGPDTDIVIQGPRTTVLWAVARLAGLADDRSVETRDSTNDDGTRVVVDRQRAPGRPEMLAEVLRHAQPALHTPPPSWEHAWLQQIADLEEIKPPPGWEERAVERARRAGIIPGDDWAVLDIRGETSYGRILSRHTTEVAAQSACDAEAARHLGTRSPGTKDAVSHLMWTTARIAGEVGERVRYR